MGRKWMVMLVRPITHLHVDYIHIHRCVDNSLDGWSHTESEIKKEEEEKTLKHPKSNWLNFMEPCHCFLLCVARICLFRVVIFLRLLRLCLNSNKNTLVFYICIHQLQINCFSTFFASTVLVCVSVSELWYNINWPIREMCENMTNHSSAIQLANCEPPIELANRWDIHTTWYCESLSHCCDCFASSSISLLATISSSHLSFI